MTKAEPSDVLRGTLDLLVLKTLTLEPMHGWGISQRIQQHSRSALGRDTGLALPGVATPRAERLDRQRLADLG